MKKILILALAAGCAGPRVRSVEEAVVTSCAGVADGTTCGDECFGDGICRQGVCTDMTFAAAGTACVSGDACSSGDTCDGAGSCVAGPPMTCDDGDDCTADHCEADVGCVHEPICPVAEGGGPTVSMPAPIAVSDPGPSRPGSTWPGGDRNSGNPVDLSYKGGACSVSVGHGASPTAWFAIAAILLAGARSTSRAARSRRRATPSRSGAADRPRD